MKFIQYAWSKLYCMAVGHFYRPLHFVRGGKVQYRCDCCGQETKWMHKREHRDFISAHCPTWGDRGSDSQGYRK